MKSLSKTLICLALLQASCSTCGLTQPEKTATNQSTTKIQNEVDVSYQVSNET
ncbi:MAG: hypothetical protein NXI20_10095 [bacterium]|nr:hypothetical protein [bacterium]